MELMREAWTDERLDDLNREVKDGFTRIDERFTRIDERFTRIDERFEQIEERADERFDRVDKRLEKLEDRFASLQLTLLVVGGGLMGTVIACSSALVATQI